ncbi:hypothetical protein J2X85_001197 [Microbacterium trichothecenolyticum]|nr:hypothetical protein [Microbacterium trichothecenolyticum]
MFHVKRSSIRGNPASARAAPLWAARGVRSRPAVRQCAQCQSTQRQRHLGPPARALRWTTARRGTGALNHARAVDVSRETIVDSQQSCLGAGRAALCRKRRPLTSRGAAMRAMPVRTAAAAPRPTGSCTEVDCRMTCGNGAALRRRVPFCSTRRTCTLREATRTQPARQRLVPPMPTAAYGRDARDDGSLRGPCTPRDSTPPTLCTEEGHGAHRGDTASPTATCSAGRSCAAGWTWALCLRRRPSRGGACGESSVIDLCSPSHVSRETSSMPRPESVDRIPEAPRETSLGCRKHPHACPSATVRRPLPHGGVSARSAAAVFPLLSCAPQDTTTAPSAPKRTRPPRRRAARTTQFPSSAPSSTRKRHPCFT